MRGKLIAVAVLLMATAFPAAAQSTLEKVSNAAPCCAG
jgi:hypothetical protein